MHTGHTFGGSALDRYIYEFEPEGDGDLGSGVDVPPDPDPPPGDPPADDTPAGEPAPAATAWDRDDPEFLEFVDSRAAELVDTRIAPLVPLLEALANGGGDPPADEPAALGALDPWADDFGQNLDQRFQALEERLAGMVERVTQPFEQREQAETIARGNENIDAMIADDITRNGELGEKAKSLVRPLADALYPQFAARYGQSSRGAEMAVTKASQIIREIVAESRIPATGDADVEHLATLAGARGDLNGSGSGSGVTTFPNVPLTSAERVAKYAPALQAARG